MKNKSMTLIFMNETGLIFLIWEKKNRVYFENRYGVISTHQIQEFYSSIASDISNSKLFLIGEI